MVRVTVVYAFGNGNVTLVHHVCAQSALHFAHEYVACTHAMRTLRGFSPTFCGENAERKRSSSQKSRTNCRHKAPKVGRCSDKVRNT